LNPVLNIEKAACELCWETLFPDRPMPLAVFWLGRYDLWKYADHPGSLEFQYGMRLYNTSPDNQEFWHPLFVYNLTLDRIRHEGALLLQYEQKQNRNFAAAYAFETQLDGLR